MPLAKGRQPSPQRQTVLTFATPSVADLFFYETVDAQGIALESLPQYGTAHPDSRKWPNHKLVYIQNDSEEGLFYKFFYAADRESQDAYNYELREGRSLMRTYVLPRADYPTLLPPPAGGTLDSVFTAYGFTGDSLVDIGEPLNGWYVVIQRQYEEASVTDVVFDNSLELNIAVTKTIKPVDYELADDALVSGEGIVYEVRHGNAYHSMLLTTNAAAGLTFPHALPTTYSAQDNYPFPPKLTDYTILYQWAGVAETSPLPWETPRFAYAEDMAPTYTLVAPKRGPFKTKIQRWLTDDPDTLLDTILAAATVLPQTRRETVVVAYEMVYVDAYFVRAFVREFPVPEAYHEAVVIGGDIPDFQSGVQEQVVTPSTLAATVGFTGDFTGDFLIDVTSSKTTAELYEVVATSLVLAGIYS